MDAAHAGDKIVVKTSTAGARLEDGGPIGGPGSIVIQGTGNAVVGAAKKSNGNPWVVALAIGSGWQGTEVRNVTFDAGFGIFSGETSDKSVKGASTDIRIHGCTFRNTTFQGISGIRGLRTPSGSFGISQPSGWVVKNNRVELIAPISGFTTIGISPLPGADNWEITSNDISGGDKPENTVGIAIFATGSKSHLSVEGTTIHRNRIATEGSAVQLFASFLNDNDDPIDGVINDTIVAMNDFRGSVTSGTSNLDVFTQDGPIDVAGLGAFDKITQIGSVSLKGSMGKLAAFGNIESNGSGRGNIAQSQVKPSAIFQP